MKPNRLLNLDQVRQALQQHRSAPASAHAPTQWAAVAAVLHQDQAGQLMILLIRRARRPSDPWSGHMAFPGGRMEAIDRDLLETAVRETMEEVGLDLLREGELLGQLEPVQAVARGQRVDMLIVPYVFAVIDRPALVKSSEVEDTLWVSVETLVSGELSTTTTYEHSGLRLELPAYDVQGNIIWGLTYQMLARLLQVTCRMETIDAP